MYRWLKSNGKLSQAGGSDVTEGRFVQQGWRSYPGVQDAVSRGKATYEQACASCHSDKLGANTSEIMVPLNQVGRVGYCPMAMSVIWKIWSARIVATSNPLCTSSTTPCMRLCARYPAPRISPHLRLTSTARAMCSGFTKTSSAISLISPMRRGTDLSSDTSTSAKWLGMPTTITGTTKRCGLSMGPMKWVPQRP